MKPIVFYGVLTAFVVCIGACTTDTTDKTVTPTETSTVNEEAEKKAKRIALKKGIQKENRAVKEDFKLAESYFYSRQYEDAIKTYQKIKEAAVSEAVKNKCDERIAENEERLAKRPNYEAEKELTVPTVAWWNELDTAWQNLLRGDYFKGEANDKNLERMFTNLRDIDCRNTDVTDLKAIIPLKKLIYLNIGGTKITDLSPLKGFFQLRSLKCVNSPVTSLEPIKDEDSLQEFLASYSKIESIEPMKSWIELRHLDISGTPIKSIMALEGMHVMVKFSCSNIKVPASDFKVLKYMGALEELHCSGTNLNNLTPLSRLTNLHTININGTQVDDLKPIENLPNLEVLYCQKTKVTKAAVEAFQKKQPKCKVVF